MKRIACLVFTGMVMFSNGVLAADCQPYFSSIHDMYDLPPGSDPESFDRTPYHVESVRLYHDGNTSFGMNEHYNPAMGYFNDDGGINTGFSIIRHNDEGREGEAYAVSGKFQDMFPSRNAAALTTFSIYRSGEAKIMLDEEGGQEFPLEALNCRGIDHHHFIMEGDVHVPPYTSTWMFTVKRDN